LPNGDASQRTLPTILPSDDDTAPPVMGSAQLRHFGRNRSLKQPRQKGMWSPETVAAAGSISLWHAEHVMLVGCRAGTARGRGFDWPAWVELARSAASEGEGVMPPPGRSGAVMGRGGSFGRLGGGRGSLGPTHLDWGRSTKNSFKSAAPPSWSSSSVMILRSSMHPSRSRPTLGLAPPAVAPLTLASCSPPLNKPDRLAGVLWLALIVSRLSSSHFGSCHPRAPDSSRPLYAVSSWLRDGGRFGRAAPGPALLEANIGVVGVMLLYCPQFGEGVVPELGEGVRAERSARPALRVRPVAGVSLRAVCEAEAASRWYLSRKGRLRAPLLVADWAEDAIELVDWDETERTKPGLAGGAPREDGPDELSGAGSRWRSARSNTHVWSG